jgi:hypothetical protein
MALMPYRYYYFGDTGWSWTDEVDADDVETFTTTFEKNREGRLVAVQQRIRSRRITKKEPDPPPVLQERRRKIMLDDED